MRMVVFKIDDLLLPTASKNGYFNITSRTDGTMLFAIKIGQCAPENAQLHLRFSQENSCRLFKNRNHVSSWQSRNEKAQEYAGAVVVKNFIFSFFGSPPELLNEAVALNIVLGCGRLTKEEALKIANISNNPYFPH